MRYEWQCEISPILFPMQELTDYPDMVQHLLSVPGTLGLRNVRALRLTCKAWKGAIPSLPPDFYKDRMIATMQEWGIADIADKLCLFLSLEGMVVVAGSFVLRAVLGSDETWMPNDLDIFCDLESRERLTGFLQESGFWRVSPFSSDPSDTATATVTPQSMWWYDKNPKSWSSYYQRNKTVIQLISFEDCDDLLGIVANFDLSFCSLSFDGEKVTVPSPTTWNDVLDKSTVCPFKVQPERYQKYQERQFRIVEKVEEEEEEDGKGRHKRKRTT